MKILVLAPLPPPITGHSLASQVLVDALRQGHDVSTVDLGIASGHDGRVSRARVFQVAKALLTIWRRHWAADAIYLTIAESLAGNLKDLVIYTLCAGRLSRMFLHLHGGTIGSELFDRHAIVRWVNAAFIRRMAGVIISGPAHSRIFAEMIDEDRIHVVPNFAQDHLFISDDGVAAKFRHTRPLRVLYLSAMTKPKGYSDLLDAYCMLGRESRTAIQLDFAGRFESHSAEQEFRERIRELEGVRYHGLVDDDEKQRLFAEAHVFCLPTAMLEGQPISILEAYASGCLVITTAQRGIGDVFVDGQNGFAARAGDAASIRDCVARALRDSHLLEGIASANRRIAEKLYRTETFGEEMRRVLES